MEVLEDIPGCIVAPGLPTPDQGVNWLSCSPVLALARNLSSLDCLLLVACAKGRQTLKNTKNSKFSFRAALTLEQFRRVLVRPSILVTEICSMGKSLRSFKPVFILFFDAYGALILEAM